VRPSEAGDTRATRAAHRLDATRGARPSTGQPRSERRVPLPVDTRDPRGELRRRPISAGRRTKPDATDVRAAPTTPRRREERAVYSADPLPFVRTLPVSSTGLSTLTFCDPSPVSFIRLSPDDRVCDYPRRPRSPGSDPARLPTRSSSALADPIPRLDRQWSTLRPCRPAVTSAGVVLDDRPANGRSVRPRRRPR
jgi:hypothetical protein